MKIRSAKVLFALLLGLTATLSIAQNPLIIEGTTYIGGCDTGLRKVDGGLFCPPDNPNGGGRVPPGYFWDPAAYDASQVLRADRTGAFVRIAKTGQHCTGNNMIFTFNNGDVIDQGPSSACRVSVSGGGASGGGGEGGWMGPDGRIYSGPDTSTATVCYSCTRVIGMADGQQSTPAPRNDDSGGDSSNSGDSSGGDSGGGDGGGGSFSSGGGDSSGGS